MTRSPRAAQRREMLKWLRLIASVTATVRSRWDVRATVYEPNSTAARPWRPREVNEYPENRSSAWSQLAHDAGRLSDSWGRIADHARQQARIVDQLDT